MPVHVACLLEKTATGKSYNCHCDSPNVRTSFYQLSQLDQPLISSADDNLINDLQRYERGWGVFVFVCRACEGFAVEGSQRYESRGGGIPAITKAGVKVLRILI